MLNLWILQNITGPSHILVWLTPYAKLIEWKLRMLKVTVFLSVIETSIAIATVIMNVAVHLAFTLPSYLW